jgi:hypothetical protein
VQRPRQDDWRSHDNQGVSGVPERQIRIHEYLPEIGSISTVCSCHFLNELIGGASIS